MSPENGSVRDVSCDFYGTSLSKPFFSTVCFQFLLIALSLLQFPLLHGIDFIGKDIPASFYERFLANLLLQFYDFNYVSILRKADNNMEIMNGTQCMQKR